MRKIFLLICLCSFSSVYAGLPYYGRYDASDEYEDSFYSDETKSSSDTTCRASRYNEGDCDDFGSNDTVYDDEENSYINEIRDTNNNNDTTCYTDDSGNTECD